MFPALHCFGPKKNLAKTVMAPVYMAAWAQEHASSETCLMASSYRKECALLGLIRGKHLPRGSMLS